MTELKASTSLLRAARRSFFASGWLLAALFLLPLTSQARSGRKHKPKPCVACSISGPNPVLYGNTYTYNLNGSCAVNSWTTTCGSVQGYNGTSAVIYFGQTGCSTATIKVLNINGVTLASLTVTVNQPPALVPGTITANTYQTINYNAEPGLIQCSAASGGACGGAYSYQWYSSPNNSTWTAISGATTQNYQPGYLTATTYYRRSVTCGTQAGYSTNTAEVYVYPQINGGSITPASQSINYNTVPAQLSVTGVSGGIGTYTYQWYSSPDNSSWQPISGATGTTYTPPALTATTYYIVVVYSNGASASGSSAVVTVYPAIQPGSVSPSQTINYNTAPTSLSVSGVSGGNGSYTYQWYYSSNGGGTWTAISGATLATYAPGALTTSTEYEVVVTSNGSSATSGVATITVYPQLVTGTISPSSQTINYGRVPGAMTISGTTGGNGTYSYQWESATASGGPYTPIGGATGSSYTPGALIATTRYEVVTTSNGVPVTSAPAVVNVNPQVIPGVITPSNLLINSGTSPGLLTSGPASGGACSGSFTYQWQSAPDNATWTNISGVTGLTYNPGNLSATIYYRIQVTCGTDVEYSASAAITVGTVGTNLNYIRYRSLYKAGVTDTVTADGLTSPYDALQSTTYFDGLGRSIQTVAKQASPLQHDMVLMQPYDPFGRVAVQPLPYTSPSNDGNYKPNAASEQYNFNAAQYPSDQFYYAETGFEASSLNRVLNDYPAGNSWVGSGRSVGHQYQVNTGADSVQVWVVDTAVGAIPVNSGTYASGELFKNVTTNENGHQVVEYLNNENLIVLKKVQSWSTPAAGHSGWLCTYYVYDYMNNLKFIISPQAVVALMNAGSWNLNGPINLVNELCFRYQYDLRSRMIIKKGSGMTETWQVYDARDRLVMRQDSNLRVQGKWEVMEYDSLNRPFRTGLLTDPNNRAYHQNLASSSITYPNTSGGNYEILTQTYYDDYSWVSGTGAPLSTSMASNYTGNGSYFVTSLNTSPTYAVAMTPFAVMRGNVTGTRTEVLGSNGTQYLYDVEFYDDRGRAIQTQMVNYTGAVDTVTNQYNFSGDLLRTLVSHKKGGNTIQNHTIVTKFDYDQSSRLRHIWKNIDGAAVDQLIDSLQFNELGQLSAKYLGNNLDSLIYTYNIRGWLSGINPNYIAGTASHYFGMELGYDKTTSVAPGNTYITPEYNGNLEGTVWKSAGSGINRKYDFSYDLVNRLNSAAFLQNTSGSSWDKNQVDYSVSGLNYDANGNILSMTQHGFTIGSSGAIDSLTYSYMSNSNKLMGVTDAANNPTSQLGDFHYNPSTKQSTDYNYDGNGNLIQDNNKSIDKIIYNYLNLPQLVHLNGKGNVSYVYDADGIKLAKITTDSMAQHSVRTLYIEGIVYQQTGTMGNPGGATDTLQFISHEEGRARWAYHKYQTVSPGYRFEYDFFEQDHLGNTRVALTQEQDTTNYIATMEAAYRTTESQLFGNIASTSVAFTAIPNYQNIPSGTRYAYTNPNDSVSKVDYNGTTGQTTGPSLLLKVMSGDTIMPSVQCYYASNTITTTNSSFSSVLNSLAAGIVGTSTGAAEGTLSGYTASGSPVYSGLSSFLSTKDQAPPSGYPKAYLNWILLDDQFNYVSSSSGSVATASTTYPANQMNAVAPGGPIVIPRNGYLYVWVSNETQGWDVFFDNFSVQYKQGRVLEENHYYPFGLTMAGISDKAIRTNYAENKFRFNDASELQNKEFSDGTGLEAYDATFRFFDPQLGRFMQQDPLASLDESWAPYTFTHDNPLSFSDPSGLSDTLPTVIVTPNKGVGLANTAGPAPNVTAPPCPTSVAAPIDPTTIPTPWMNNILNDAAECKGVAEIDDPTCSLGETALNYVHAKIPNPHMTAWCAALGSWELHTSGYPNPRSAGSGEWLDNKTKTLKETGPYYGAIAIFKDYSDKNLKHPTGSGHITFLYGFDKDGTYVFIGGNQSDKLKFNAYKKTFYIKKMKCYMHLEGFYFPSSYHGPKVIAPLVPSDAKLNKYMGIDGSGAQKTN